MQLSKSEFLMYLKHPVLLWLKKNDKSKLPPIDDNLQAIFDAGSYFESFANPIFGEGTTIGWSMKENNYSSMPARTKKAIEQGAKTLFQARFETPSITCICDVVIKVDENTFDLYEIKSGTSVKQENLYDLAFQTIVLTDCGYKVRKIGVVTANNQYVRKGEIDSKVLCKKTDVTADVRVEIDDIRALIKEAQAYASQRTMPDITAPDEDGNLYAWLEIFLHLNPQKRGSIFDLCWPKQKVAQLYDMGIEKLVDIPEDFVLSPKQKLQVSAAKSGERIIDIASIGKYMEKLQFPLYFLDYETLASVVPPFNGLSPYEQLPFQYSLHVLDSPEGELKHFTYLHRENSDPTIALSESLQECIGTSGTILTWNESFEKRCNDLMARVAPKYKKFYADVNNRVADLCIPFQKNWYVDHGFLGSYSIKKVLPVLVPELSYSSLGINEGAAAQRLWMGSVLGDKYTDQRESILADLDKYCELDTLAMVKIYETLRELLPSEQLSLIL